MIYWLELIIVLVLFGFHDFFIERKINKNILLKLVLRFTISTIFSIILFYFTNESFVIHSIYTQSDRIISFSILLIINLAISMFSKFKIMQINKIYYSFLKILLILLTLELTVFNYQHYLTLNLRENKIQSIESIHLKKHNSTYTATSDNKIGFKIKLSNSNVKSLYFPIKNIDSKLVTYKIKVLDKESNSYIELNQTNSYNGISKSYYKTIHNAFNTNTLFLEIIGNQGDIFSLNTIKVNETIPINFSYIRVFLLFFIICLFYLFSPQSEIYNMKFTSKKGKLTVCSFIGITIILVTILVNLNPIFKKNNSYRYLYPLVSINEYQELTESLLKGKFYLDIEPSEELKNLKNPYNPYERSKNKVDYLWDVAYYNGHYYVYFGIVPVIVSYLPYYLITGNHIDNNIVNLMALIIMILSFVSLIKIIMKRYFKSENTGLLLLMLLFCFFANHFIILYIARRPDFYTIPVIFGIMFGILGLNLWIRSQREDGSLNKIYLLLGSLCMALVSGCRPQLLLVSLSALPIFWNNFINKKIFSKKSWKETICFCLPYIIIAILIMRYNMMRFGSIFDFGANYNLTTNDMTARGISFERFLSAIYYYFLAFPRITNVFPFIETLPLSTSYIGITIYEKTFGGILMLCPILIVGLLFYKFKDYFPNKELYHLSEIFTIIAIIIALIDSQMAGILPRYFLDFNWLLALSTVIVLFSIIKKYHKTKLYSKILSILSKTIIILVIFNILMCFIDVSFSYRDILPSLFYKFYYLVQFWL